MPKCVLCNLSFDADEPTVLTVGAYGNAKYVCDDCVKLLDRATRGETPEQIQAAIVTIVDLISASDVDKQTFDTVNSLLASAKERLEKIKDGSYDFSLDDETETYEESFDEIPPELQELESDKELDRIEEEKYAKVDKVLNVVTVVLAVLAGAFLIWRVVEWLL